MKLLPLGYRYVYFSFVPLFVCCAQESQTTISKFSRYIIVIQCLIFHCRPLSRRSPARPASLLLHVTVPGAFLQPAEGSCRIENLNSSVYVYHANLQSENCETPVSCDNLLRDFLGLRSNICPISSSFSSVSTW